MQIVNSAARIRSGVCRAAALLAAAVVAGCAPVYEPGVSVQPSPRVFGPDGIVREGGTIAPPPEYRINPGDQLSIRFPRRPAYSDNFVVRADGRISAPLVGSVTAASRTSDELQKDLVERYRQLLSALPPAPDRSYLLQAEDVLDIRFTFFPDLNSVVTVRPDGRISLPMVGELIAEGVSPAELQKRLVQMYAPRIQNPELVVILKEARSGVFLHQGEIRPLPDPGLIDLAVNVTRTTPLVVYVGGEVPAPGIQPFVTGVTVLQAIYAAGGPTPTGDMRSVVIMRRIVDDGVLRVVADLTQDLSGKGTANAMIQPFDVVVVPRSTIAQVGDALDQYLYRIIRPLANSSVGFYFTRQVGTVEQRTTLQQ